MAAVDVARMPSPPKLKKQRVFKSRAAPTGKAPAIPVASKICHMDPGNVDCNAFKALTMGKFRVDMTEDFDKTPMGNAWKPVAGGRGVEVALWLPEELVVGAMTPALQKLGPQLLQSLREYAEMMTISAKRKSFLKKLDTEGFTLTNPSRVSFDHRGHLVGWKSPAYARIVFTLWKAGQRGDRLDGTFRIQDATGGNITKEIADDTGVPVDEDEVQYRKVDEDGESTYTDITGFAPFVRFDDKTSEFVRGALTGQLNYEEAAVRLCVQDPCLWFNSAMVTDHQGYITVKLRFSPGYKPEETKGIPGTVMVRNSITATLEDDNDKPIKSGFV